jgi:starch synthase (maltosyl-transferring)
MPELAALGFDHILTDSAQMACDAVTEARAHGLALLLRLSLDAPSPHASLTTAQPDWFARSHESDTDLPDPRRKPGAIASPRLRLDEPAIASSVQDAWATQLKVMAAKGVAGFCLSLEGPASPNFFAAVIRPVKAAFPECRFLAWTIGIDASRAVAVADCGFDGAFSSSAWWDFQSAWLQQECDRLRAFGSLIALAARPKSHAASASPGDMRWLALAALIADGVQVPGELLRTGDAEVIKAHLLQMKPEVSGNAVNAFDINNSSSMYHPGSAGKLGGAAKAWQLLSAPGAAVAVLLGQPNHSKDADDVRSSQAALPILVVNTQDKSATSDVGTLLARMDGLTLRPPHAGGSGADPDSDGSGCLVLQPREFRLMDAERSAAVFTATRESKRAVEASARQSAKKSRISIEAISPAVDNGLFVVKRSVGEMLVVEADIFGEGHDLLAACVQWRAADTEAWSETPMRSGDNDRWLGEFQLARVGRYQYRIEAWIDTFGAWRDEVQKKTTAGQQVALELQEGQALVDAALNSAKVAGNPLLAEVLAATQKAVEAAKDESLKVELMLAAPLQHAMAGADERVFHARSTTIDVDSERRAAGFSSWYELFPRSMGQDAATHGTLLDVLPRLPAIRRMGFDTLYLLPIHPIGRQHRKGPNNSLTASASDPGSPYAIGSADGGHDAIHRQLGTLDDFRTLVRAAQSQGLEIALDFAVQCSPDHPWLKQHPDWFSWRPDGTIRYAENPPKKYQDIVNVDFYAEGAVPALWIALRNVVLFWVQEGVKVFRVDNPHTKPMPFWEWLIASVRARHPEVIFLAEAFTRPKPMYRLAKVGFSQSYTYFTWRHTKQEFIEYMTELTEGAPRDFFRPHFFVNTPDINPYFLQRSGRAGFVIRAALATTLSGLWGMYSGFELCEAEPVPGKEEYLDSEKYQIRHRDWSQPGNIVQEITLLNTIRQQNPALQTHLSIRFCPSSGEHVLCFTKTSPGNVLFIAICLDPHAAHECEFELPLQDWGLPEGAPLEFEDLVHGNTFTLQGRHQRLRLDPALLAFSIWRLHGPGVH